MSGAETSPGFDDMDQGKLSPSISSTTPNSTPTNTPTPEMNHHHNMERTYVVEDFTPPTKISTHDLSDTYSWNDQLKEPTFVAAPVSAFHHAPMADGWDNIIIGMKVEVENDDADTVPGVFRKVFWVATVLRISGYKVLLRYEGFGQDGSKDFWINLCSDKVHPVGWCATKGEPLIPPKTIQSKYADWKEFLVKRLTGARTLPTNFYRVVWEHISSNFKPGMKLEVVDKMRISQVRVATVVDVTGRRLGLVYDDSSGNSGGAGSGYVEGGEGGFWCHEESPLVHHVGWARKVGHQIAATSEYHDRCLMETFHDTDTTPDMFPEYRQPPGSFAVGMKLEAVDPLSLATICVATVMKVLRHGYIMIRMDGYESDPTGGDWFCYHASSPLIFPPGFCQRHNIKLKVPTGYEGDFEWVEYLRKTKCPAAPVSLFMHRDDHKHGFKVGMKVECTDLMDPRLVCVGTISRVVNRLLKVHFDGWEADYDQWMDCDSVDICPVGWSELVGHRLEGPRKKQPMKKERKRKSGTKKAIGESVRGSGVGSGGRSAVKKPKVAAGRGSGTPTPVDGLRSRSPTPTPPVLEMEVPNIDPVKREDASTISPQNQPADLKSEPDGLVNSVVGHETNGSATSQQSQPVSNGQAKIVDDTKPANPPPGAAIAPTVSSAISSSALPANSVGGSPASSANPPPPQPYIPRLVEGGNSLRLRDVNLDVVSWSVEHVKQFLEKNECANLTPAFMDEQIDGRALLLMNKEDIKVLVNNKIGPCLKIENLIALLKAKIPSSQLRSLQISQ